MTRHPSIKILRYDFHPCESPNFDAVEPNMQHTQLVDQNSGVGDQEVVMFGVDKDVDFQERACRLWTEEIKAESRLVFPHVLKLESVQDFKKVIERRSDENTAQLLFQDCGQTVLRSKPVVPFSKIDFRTMVSNHWAHARWVSLWQNSNGGTDLIVGPDTAPNALVLQTPRDDRPFVSLCLFDENVCKGIMVAQEAYSLERLLSAQAYPDFTTTRYPYHDLMVLPILILEKDVVETLSRVEHAERTVEHLEMIIEGATGPLGRSILNQLRACLSTHSALVRRLRFEKSLSDTLLNYFRTIEDKKSRTNYRSAHKYTYEADSVRRVQCQRRTSALCEDRLEHMVLMIQQCKIDIRDTNSYLLTEATQKDSSSMKTIAVLTLIFLPAVAVASIFSMSMFNWQASPNEPTASSRLWIYFAVAVPLTAIVLAIWLIWYYWKVKEGAPGKLLHELVAVNVNHAHHHK